MSVAMPDEQLDAGSLEKIYRSPVTKGAAPLPLRASAAVDEAGRAYFGLGPVLLALSTSAEVLWSRTLGGTIPGPAVIGADGLIRVHAADGGLSAFDPSGELIWGPIAVGLPLGHAAPTVDSVGNTYVNSSAGGVLKVGPVGVLDPRPYWWSGRRMDAPALILDDVYYVGGDDHCLHAIDLSGPSGRSLWNADHGQGRTGWYIHSAPALAPGPLLIVTSRDHRLHAFTSHGTPVWSYEPGGQLLGSPVLDAQGRVLVGVSRCERGFEPTGALLCVRGDGNEVLWEYEAQGPVESTPVIGADNVIYLGDNAGFVHAVGGTGNLLWCTQHEAPVRSAGALFGKQRIAVGLDDGSLAVLICSSPRLAQQGWPKYRGDPGQSGLAKCP